ELAQSFPGTGRVVGDRGKSGGGRFQQREAEPFEVARKRTSGSAREELWQILATESRDDLHGLPIAGGEVPQDLLPVETCSQKVKAGVRYQLPDPADDLRPVLCYLAAV